MPADGKPASLPVALRILIALAFAATGAIAMLAALDFGPLYQRDIAGPPWIAGAAGAVFLAGGLAIASADSPQRRWVGPLTAVLVIAGLAAIANWIAFGAGSRECSGSVSLPFFASDVTVGDLACRFAFGTGALMVDGMFLWWLGSTLGRSLGPGRLPSALETAGKWVVFVGALPFVLLLAAWTVASAFAASFREYRRTGTWPRNEAFIARMKRKRGPSP